MSFGIAILVFSGDFSFRVCDDGFSLEIRVHDLQGRAQGLESGVQGPEERVQGLGLRLQLPLPRNLQLGRKSRHRRCI